MGFDLYGLNPKIKEGSVEPKRPDWNTATEAEKDEYYSAMDIFEEQNKGFYFRNNVWWWRRLADFVMTETGVVDEKDADNWHENGGHQVSQQEEEQIANQLEYLISTGRVQEYAKEVQEKISRAEETNKKVQEKFDKLHEKAIAETNDKGIIPRDYPEHLKAEWNSLWEEKDNNENYLLS